MRLQVSVFFVLLTQPLWLAECLPCALDWQTESLGSLPDDAIESGPGEYIVRVLANGDWNVARLNPRVGKVTLVIKDVELVFESYDVLTNPDNCIVRWVKPDSKYSSAPEGAVEATIGSSTYVGRGKTNGYIISGTIIGNTALYITHRDKEEILTKFEFLTAIYPKLYGSLNVISFDKNTIMSAYTTAYKELVGSTLSRTSTGGSATDSEVITHGKTLQENFTFIEDNLDWSGIESLDFYSPLWFGTSDIKETVHIKGRKVIQILKLRDLRFTKTINLPNNRNLQVCTYFKKLRPTDQITFTALAELKADGMNVAQVKRIMAGYNRAPQDSYPESNSVTTVITGKLLGRFALELYSNEYPLNAGTDDGKCFQEMTF